MKKQAIIIGTLMTLISTTIVAQYCPPNTSSRSNDRVDTYSDIGWNSYRTHTSLYNNSSPMQRLTSQFSNVISEGWRLGKLTKNEIRGLENDFRSVEREIRLANSNRNISFIEQNMIDTRIRRLQRNIKREWNDNDIRIG